MQQDWQPDLTEFDNLGPEAGEFVFQAIDFGMDSLDPSDGADDTFTPFAMVLAADGSGEIWRLFDDDGTAPTVEGGLALGRDMLRDVDAGTKCVALGWDGYLTLDEDRTEAVFVEGYELGRPVGVLMAQRYVRRGGGIDLIGNPVLLNADPEPLVPRSVR